MGNKEWDNYLREILGDFKSEGGPTDWDEVARQYDAENLTSSTTESVEDEILREKLTNYTPDGQVEGWERIESSLDASEAEFDQQMRSRIHEFHLPKDPHSWQSFLNTFSKHKILRAKLIALKVFESAAVLLLLITILHMGQTGRLPLISTQPQELAQSETNSSESLNSPSEKPQPTHPSLDMKTIVEIEIKNIAKPESASTTNDEKFNVKGSKTGPSAKEKRLNNTEVINKTETNEFEIVKSSPDISENVLIALSGDIPATTEDQNILESSGIEESVLKENKGAENKDLNLLEDIDESYITASLASLSSGIEYPKTTPISDPIFVATVNKPTFEFGMLVQADYNQLKLPGDKLYNTGGPVVFPLQGLTSSGYGAGFTLAINHPIWAVETGLIYNAKSFRPGREITLGNASDHSNVEFDAIHMQLISVPLQFRYRFEPKGRLKLYALAGFGLNLITQSDIDVMVEYNFPSLNPGENPKNNPSLARTIRETERVSDDFKKKAPFSSQSYISANLGLGLEYTLAERKTLFLQTAYQYQIPNLRFSNHNGKHLLSISLQAGFRIHLFNSF
jgi:hypothetical protein